MDVERTAPPCDAPAEIWCAILDYVDLPTCLFSCARACKLFHMLTRENAFWIKRLREWFLFDAKEEIPVHYPHAQQLFAHWYAFSGGFIPGTYHEMFRVEYDGQARPRSIELAQERALELARERAPQGIAFTWLRPLYFFNALADITRWPPATAFRFEYVAAPGQTQALSYAYNKWDPHADDALPKATIPLEPGTNFFEATCRLIDDQETPCHGICVSIWRTDASWTHVDFAALVTYRLADKTPPDGSRPVLSIELPLGSKIVFRSPRPVTYVDRCTRWLYFSPGAEPQILPAL
jgi:hypothetical protein